MAAIFMQISSCHKRNIGSSEVPDSNIVSAHGSHFVNCYHGNHGYTCECLHIQKCSLGVIVHLYQVGAFMKKCTIGLVCCCTSICIVNKTKPIAHFFIKAPKLAHI